MVEKRVAAREHEAVEVAVGGKAQQDAPVVDADAERLDDASRTKIGECPVCAAHRLGVPLLDEVPLPAAVDVVDQHEVDRVRAQPLQAVLERAQRSS